MPIGRHTVKSKTKAYQAGWADMMFRLELLLYPLDQQLYMERMYDAANRYLMYAQDDEKEYVEGLIAAILEKEKK